MTRIQTITLAVFSVLLSLALAAMTSALTLTNPQPTEYNGTIPVLLSESESATLAYTVSPSGLNGSCENCTNLTGSLDLAPGNYTLNATSVVGNVTQAAAVTFSVVVPANQSNQTNETQELGPVTITITNPQNTTYNTTNVSYAASANETVDTLAYSLDGNTYTSACQNCTNLSGTLANLTEGSHTFSARATRGNQTFVSSVGFSVALPTNQSNQTNSTPETNLTLTIVSPQNQTYTTSGVQLKFETNKNAAISYTLNGANTSACANCSLYTENKTLANGSYTLLVLATSGNQSVNKTVNFAVSAPSTVTNGTNNNTNQTPRFDKLNKLPKLVEQGNITDAELAQIIRTHKINPGTLNRLIKTGKLGNASITAILETQKTPPSIIFKIGRFIGFDFKTPREQLLDHYNLTEEQNVDLLINNGISEKAAEKAKKQLEQRKQEKKQDDDEDDNERSEKSSKQETSQKSDNNENRSNKNEARGRDDEDNDDNRGKSEENRSSKNNNDDEDDDDERGNSGKSNKSKGKSFNAGKQK